MPLCHLLANSSFGLFNMRFINRAALGTILKQALYLTPILFTLIPIGLLVGYSSSLSRALGQTGCLPNGNFVLPHTSSIWDPKYFFTITAPLKRSFGLFQYLCEKNLNRNPTQALRTQCTGDSFTTVKLIDVAWDFLVGRGTQVVYAGLAYRIFSRVMRTLMQQDEVAFDAFVAITFHSGSFTSLSGLGLNIANCVLKPSSNARRAYLGMILGTLYVVAVPTLLSAMTGYTSFYSPAVAIHKPELGQSYSTRSYGTSIFHAWGRVSWANHNASRLYTSDQWLIPYDPSSLEQTGRERELRADYIGCKFEQSSCYCELRLTNKMITTATKADTNAVLDTRTPRPVPLLTCAPGLNRIPTDMGKRTRRYLLRY